ncbi:hypothetical protein [Alicyclobacillus fastidiosus]|uniref:Uncharacterized protein n=1 Tax=Alicyclobacillus fastidiosus TaxID=392011 RepID=A0ABV5ALM9_9BACL|nr:hypothetical protein [Alicyclobacillus fastidiosus]WEH09246.1 hypothetical protein PYS47_21655 [Alicyclobacillus fastidiosus]
MRTFFWMMYWIFKWVAYMFVLICLLMFLAVTMLITLIRWGVYTIRKKPDKANAALRWGWNKVGGSKYFKMF